MLRAVSSGDMFQIRSHRSSVDNVPTACATPTPAQPASELDRTPVQPHLAATVLRASHRETPCATTTSAAAPNRARRSRTFDVNDSRIKPAPCAEPFAASGVIRCSGVLVTAANSLTSSRLPFRSG
jgi:hypothetical protein